MIRQRHPEVADMMISCLSERSGLRHLDAAVACREELIRTGYSPPEWRAVSTAQPHFIADHLPGVVGIPVERWQQRRVVVAVPRRSSWQLSRTLQCLSALSCVSTLTSSECSFLRRLRLPLPLSSHSCRCGRLLDCLGHHRASCSRAGVLERCGFALESAAARVCREGRGEGVHQRLPEGPGPRGNPRSGPTTDRSHRRRSPSFPRGSVGD